MQHYRTRATTGAHGRLTTAKPPSPVRLRSPPPTTLLQMGTFLLCAEVHRYPVADIRPTRRDVIAQHAVPQQTTGLLLLDASHTLLPSLEKARSPAARGSAPHPRSLRG